MKRILSAIFMSFMLFFTLFLSDVRADDTIVAGFYSYDSEIEAEKEAFFETVVGAMIGDQDVNIVPCNEQSCYYDLNNGTLDVVIGAPFDIRLYKNYQFVGMEYYQNIVSLYALSEDEDYQTYLYDQHKKIGVISNSYAGDLYEIIKDIHGIYASAVYYDDLAQIDEAMKSGEIDAFVYSDLPNKYEYRNIHKLSNMQAYYVSNNASTYLDLLEKYEINSGTYNYYYNQYFVPSINNDIEFTKEELDYLKTNPVVKYAIDPAWAPIESFENGDPKGISQNLIDYISEQTGITFEVVKTNTFMESVSLFKNGKVDLLSGSLTTLSKYVENLDQITDSYLSVPVNNYYSEKADKTNPTPTVAIHRLYLDLYQDILELKPNLKLAIYDSFEDCLKAVEENKVDLTSVNMYVGAKIINDLKLSHVEVEASNSFHDDLAFAIDSNDKVLLGIINKVINEMNDCAREQLTQGQTNVYEANSVLDIYMDFPIVWIIPIVIVALLILIGISLNKKSIKDLHEKLFKTSFEDNETGYGNINYFKKTVELLRKNLVEGVTYAVMVIDLGKLQHINVIKGQGQGEQILVKLGDILNDSLIADEVFGRLSSSRFVVFKRYIELENINTFMEIVQLRLGEFLSQESVQASLDVSYGICVVDDRNESIETLIEKCEIALANIPDNAVISHCYYDEELHTKVNEETEIESLMEKALMKQEFTTRVQPKYDITNRKIIGGEFLIRWKNEKLGFLSAAKFVPLFEKNGFIRKIDIHVIEQICEFIKRYEANDMPLIPFSCNLSWINFNNPNLVDEILLICEKNGVDPKYIEIEVNESAFGENNKMVINTMNKFKEKGFRIALDNFGTGYSSFNIVKEVKFDVIKLDKSFIKDEINGRDIVVLKNILKLTKDLQTDLICEGVETEKQVEHLKDIGITSIQGYVYSKPMTTVDFFDEYKAQG